MHAFANPPDTTIEPLKRVQNDAARLIFNLRLRDHLTDAFLQLQWLPVKFRIVFKLWLLTRMALIGRAPLCMPQAKIPVTNSQSIERRCGQPLLVIYSYLEQGSSLVKELGVLPDHRNGTNSQLISNKSVITVIPVPFVVHRKLT
jgi:hypothetical protein